MSAHAQATGARALLLDLGRSAALGAASGCRTFTGIAVLAAGATPSTRQPERTLANPKVKTALGVLAVGELVGDKLPNTPSRLELAGLPGRLLFGGLCGAVVSARRRPPVDGPALGVAPAAVLDAEAAQPPPGPDPRVRTAACVAASVLSTLAASWLGVQYRAWAAPRPRRQRRRAFVAAAVEDAAAVGLAIAGAQ